MRFFVPGCAPEKALGVYGNLRDFYRRLDVSVTDRRIFEISFRHGQKEYCFRVGEEALHSEGTTSEGTIIAIFEAKNLFFVCTTERGMVHGDPIVVGRNDIISIEDFDKEK